MLPGYAVSLSTVQLFALCLITFLTWTNTRGLKYGKGVQNVFTSMKIGSLVGVIVIGCFIGFKVAAVQGQLRRHAWTPMDYTPSAPGIAIETAFGMLVALCTAQIGSLFAADAWNNITFSAGEVRNPSRNVPLSLAFGTGLVITLYMLANLAYMFVLPFGAIQHAPSDRVAATMLQAIWPSVGPVIMAVAIMISAFGCMNGMILSGARAYYAMALDGLFFRVAPSMNSARVPGVALILQAAWIVCLVAAANLRPGHRRLRKPLQQLAGLRGVRSLDFLHPNHRRRIRSAPAASLSGPPVSSFRVSGHTGALYFRGPDYPRHVGRIPGLDNLPRHSDCAARRAGLPIV